MSLSIIFILFSLNIQTLHAKEVYYYNNYNSPDEIIKKGYNYNILKLSLDKTIIKYGEYELEPAPKMNKKRAILTTKSNKIKNLILNASVSDELLNDKDLIHINFPLSRGVQGYRIAFISPLIINDKVKYNSIEKIKKLRMAQGEGWLDSEILKYHGFNVKGYSNHKGLFKMISTGRIDIFPRGIAEIKQELEENSLEKLTFDETFLIYYPLPKFYFTHNSNKKALQRIEEGLMIAYKDGSLDKLFYEYHKESLDLINLKNKKIYKLANPFLKNLDKSYEKYNIDLIKKRDKQ